MMRHAGDAEGPGETPARRSYSVAARQLLRDTLLDGARDLLVQRQWSEITMADIARAAGVSRQTLYNEFRSRDEFVQALVLSEEARLIAAVEATIRAHLDDPTQALTHAFDVFLIAAAEDPLIRRVLSEDGADGMLPLITTRGRPVIEGAVTHLGAIMVSCWPHAQRDQVKLLSECLVRLAISYVMLPSGPATMTAQSVATLLGPRIDQIFGDR
jgi:AcrR family transcriptional regulator